MSPIFTRTLFASASVALTLAMVAAAAPATAAVSQGDVRHSIVKIDDLNLGSVAGRHTLARRLDAAVDSVCPANEAADRLAEMQCRSAAIEQVQVAVTRATAAAS